MTEEINIGPAPCEEECVQVGDLDYMERSSDECARFIALIRKHLGPEPMGARLVAKVFYHDYGPYMEVVCKFDPENDAAVDYAFLCEAKAPSRWEDK